MDDLSLGSLVTMYLVMLGPVKLILPFAYLTSSTDLALRRRLAIKAALVSGFTAVAAILLGDFVVSRLLLTQGSLLIAMSFFLMTFAWNMAYLGDPASSKQKGESADIPTIDAALFPIAFPGIIPPQGFALLVLSTQLEMEYVAKSTPVSLIVGVLLITLCNLIAMLLAVPILRLTGHQIWVLFARFLAPLFVAMGVHLFVMGLVDLGVVALSNGDLA